MFDTQYVGEFNTLYLNVFDALYSSVLDTLHLYLGVFDTLYLYLGAFNTLHLGVFDTLYLLLFCPLFHKLPLSRLHTYSNATYYLIYAAWSLNLSHKSFPSRISSTSFQFLTFSNSSITLIWKIVTSFLKYSIMTTFLNDKHVCSLWAI